MIVEGIANITQADLKYAATLGFGIKLLAVITRDFEKNEIFVRVHPTLVPRDRVLANVNGVFNGIAVVGDVVGTTTYIGRGAGQDATASAVISDIADAVVLLTTGRTLYQFNAGTMTMRTPNAKLRETDTLDIAPADAERLKLRDGDQVRVRSRHGEAVMPLNLDTRVKPGELFATFHAAEVFVNHLTSPHRGNVVMTPEYKVVAVAVERV